MILIISNSFCFIDKSNGILYLIFYNKSLKITFLTSFLIVFLRGYHKKQIYTKF